MSIIKFIFTTFIISFTSITYANQTFHQDQSSYHNIITPNDNQNINMRLVASYPVNDTEYIQDYNTQKNLYNMHTSKTYQSTSPCFDRNNIINSNNKRIFVHQDLSNYEKLNYNIQNQNNINQPEYLHPKIPLNQITYSNTPNNITGILPPQNLIGNPYENFNMQIPNNMAYGYNYSARYQNNENLADFYPKQQKKIFLSPYTPSPYKK